MKGVGRKMKVFSPSVSSVRRPAFIAAASDGDDD
jgi:hypothetical protein